ncbi:MAG: SDR family oxidoreductase [Deltaproteobacteria bacterium]|nr:SDR family oxidoreductase [Deltaproteobacteria bacterium]
MEQVLLTGFPGFLAARLVRDARAAGRAVYWHCLVLPSELAAAHACAATLGLAAADYRIYAADIRKPGLGLPAADLQAVQSVVQRCFHFAALYDLTADTATSRIANVFGTANVLDFLAGCSQLRRFNYISTCYVAGTAAGEILEDALPTAPQFRNAYEATKYEAEQLVRARMAQLPTTIFRPAVVVGDSASGETQKFDGPYVLMVFLRKIHRLLWALPNLGLPTSSFNAVPVDFVGRVIGAAGFDDASDGQTLHLADPEPPSTAEVFDTIAHRIGGRHPYAIPVAARWLLLHLLRWFPLNLLTGIPAQTIDYFFHRGRFATTNLQAACARHGIPIPSWRAVYPPIIDFAIRWNRPFHNAGLLRQFDRWCHGFQWIYGLLALAFIVAPSTIVTLLTRWDAPASSALLQQDHPLWRPLAISFLIGLMLIVTALRRAPTDMALHRYMIAVKTSSTLLFIGLALLHGSVALALSAGTDGTIALMHTLFLLQLQRGRAFGPAQRQKVFVARLLPYRFLRAFCRSFAPDALTAADEDAMVGEIVQHVQRLPWTLRYGFIAACYLIMYLVPLRYGYLPYVLLSEPQRRRCLQRLQRARHWMIRMPVYGLKTVCALYVYKQPSVQAAIGYR